MRVLVTGNNGYIGPILIDMLREHGHMAVGLDSLYFSDCEYLAPSAPDRQIVRDMRDIRPEDLEAVDAVMHLAGLSNDPMGAIDARLTDDINHLATIRLAEMAKAAGVRRFLYSSSCSMYGISSEKALTEESSMSPVTAYAHSKVDSERGLSKMADGTFSPTCLRNATAYGLSPMMRVDLVVNNLTGWAVTTGKVKIMSDGTPWRPIVHVDDISLAFVSCLEAPIESVHNEAFNVGRNDENYQIKDIASVVERIVPNCEVEYLNQAEPDQRTYNVDFSKITERIPGFKPRWTLDKGVEEIYRSFKEQGITIEEFDGNRYIRLKHLKHLMEGGQLSEDLRWTDQGGGK
ncbi:NAD-dependent epimerase/dehydratase family protein [Thermodesulfobacteriota bacterium]